MRKRPIVLGSFILNIFLLSFYNIFHFKLISQIRVLSNVYSGVTNYFTVCIFLSFFYLYASFIDVSKRSCFWINKHAARKILLNIWKNAFKYLTVPKNSRISNEQWDNNLDRIGGCRTQIYIDWFDLSIQKKISC